MNLLHLLMLVLFWFIALFSGWIFYFGLYPTRPFTRNKISGKTKDSFSFAVFGDCQQADNPFTNCRGTYFAFNNILREINKQHPLFCIILGDIVSSGRTYHFWRFKKQISKLASPVFFVIGNHDILHNGRTHFQKLFGPTYCSLDVGSYHFIILDNADETIDKEQLAWFENDLAQNKTKNIFIFMHENIFDPRAGQNYCMRDTQVAQKLKNLFKNYRVKAVFASHLHGYYTATQDNIKYFITGGGGSTLTSTQDFYHFLQVNLTGDTFQVEAIKVNSRPTWNTIKHWIFSLIILIFLIYISIYWFLNPRNRF